MTILRAVLQKLSRRQNADHSTPAVAPAPGCALLTQLEQQRQLLEIRPQHHERSYQSMIIALDFTRGLVWLDDLFPGQHSLNLGDMIEVQHHHEGQLLRFQAPIVAWGADYGASGLALPLPAEPLSYQPRRRQPRWVLSSRQPLSAKVRTLGEEPGYARVMNVSAGGVRLALPGNQLAQLRHGSILPLCEIALEPRLTLRCKAQVKAFRLEREPFRHTQVSLMFIGITPDQQQQLAAFIERQLTQTPDITRAA